MFINEILGNIFEGLQIKCLDKEKNEDLLDGKLVLFFWYPLKKKTQENHFCPIDAIFCFADIQIWIGIDKLASNRSSLNDEWKQYV